jgi:alkanesulfonate monooxygenase SsuD/methylene tetrahydromethanopterin reductase-like flavin-dependent oxidoreductase (luciferase family)
MARPKVIVNLYPVLPADGEEDRAARRPIGRDAGLYHSVLHGMTDIVRAADELGVWGVSTIEHHLHSEGYELAPCPGVIDAYWASQVKNARVGALGYVVGTRDPIRVAEEMAVIDHIAKGRFFAGFARGYQKRWTSILGQYNDVQATMSDGSEADRANREIFEERVDQILACWTQETVAFDGKYYQAPYPYDTGVLDFPARAVASRLGAPGEIDERGAVRRVAVVPSTYQKPHPPVFTAVSASLESIEFCSERGIVPVYFSNLDGVVGMASHYVEHGSKHGHAWRIGERQCIVRWPHFTASRAETRRVLAQQDEEFYRNIYGSFFPFLVAGATDMVGRITETGLFPCGTVDEQVAYWRDILDKVPCEYLCLIWHYAQAPKQSVIDEIETFMTKVLPELEVPEFPDFDITTAPPLAAE